MTTSWRKSTHSNPDGNCVEAGQTPSDPRIAVRDSKTPTGHTLRLTPSAWQTLTTTIKEAAMTPKPHVGMSAPDEVETDLSLAAADTAMRTGKDDLLPTLRRTLAALRHWNP